jgi:hypothetical protein
MIMEQNGLFIAELIGKTVWVTTYGGLGTKDSMVVGDYKGTLLGFDGEFIKLEYEIKKYAEGTGSIDKGIILINTRYIITAEEYKSSLNPK